MNKTLIKMHTLISLLANSTPECLKHTIPCSIQFLFWWKTWNMYDRSQRIKLIIARTGLERV